MFSVNCTASNVHSIIHCKWVYHSTFWFTAKFEFIHKQIHTLKYLRCLSVNMLIPLSNNTTRMRVHESVSTVCTWDTFFFNVLIVRGCANTRDVWVNVSQICGNSSACGWVSLNKFLWEILKGGGAVQVFLGSQYFSHSLLSGESGALCFSYSSFLSSAFSLSFFCFTSVMRELLPLMIWIVVLIQALVRASLEIETIVVPYSPKIVSVRPQNIFGSISASVSNRYGATGFNLNTCKLLYFTVCACCTLIQWPVHYSNIT